MGINPANPFIPKEPDRPSSSDHHPESGSEDKLRMAKEALADPLKKQHKELSKLMQNAQNELEQHPEDQDNIIAKANAEVEKQTDGFFEELPPGTDQHLREITGEHYDAVVGSMKQEMRNHYNAKELVHPASNVSNSIDSINQAIAQKYGPQASIDNVGSHSSELLTLIQAYASAPNALAKDAIFTQIQAVLRGNNTASPVAGAQINPAAAQTNPIDSLVQDFIKQCGYSGSVMVIQHGQTVFSQGYGNATGDAPNTQDTTYRWGSMTKIVTATAILQLKENYGVDLDCPITKYLPQYSDPKKYPGLAGGPPDLTIRSLLTMTSGVVPLPPANWLKHPPSLDEVIRYVAEKPRVGQGQVVYSNTGYNILAKIIESVSGMSYGNYVNQNIFQPAGMSAFAPATPSADTPEAQSHVWDNGQPEELTPDEFQQYPDYTAMRIGTGNIIGTTIDLAKFNSALEYGNPPLISPEDLDMMQTMGPNQTRFGWDPGVHTVNGAPFIEKSGAVEGEQNFYMRFPDSDTMIVITANIDPKPPLTPDDYIQPLAIAIAKLLFPEKETA